MKYSLLAIILIVLTAGAVVAVRSNNHQDSGKKARSASTPVEVGRNGEGPQTSVIPPVASNEPSDSPSVSADSLTNLTTGPNSYQTLDDSPDGAFRTHFDQYVAAADEGDLSAINYLADNLWRCSLAPSTETDLEDQLEDYVDEMPDSPESNPDAYRASTILIDLAQTDFDFCNGLDLNVDPRLIALKWAERGAAANDIRSINQYFDIGKSYFGTDDRAFLDPYGVLEFRERAMDFLARGRSLGDTQSIYRLAGVYGLGLLGEQDQVKALAHLLLMEEIDPSIDAELYERGMSIALTNEQRESAASMAEALYARCCK